MPCDELSAVNSPIFEQNEIHHNENETYIEYHTMVACKCTFYLNELY